MTKCCCWNTESQSNNSLGIALVLKFPTQIRSLDSKAILFTNYLLDGKHDKLIELTTKADIESKKKMLSSSFICYEDKEVQHIHKPLLYAPYAIATYKEDAAALKIILACAEEAKLLENMVSDENYHVALVAMRCKNKLISEVIIDAIKESSKFFDILSSMRQNAPKLIKAISGKTIDDNEAFEEKAPITIETALTSSKIPQLIFPSDEGILDELRVGSVIEYD